jgi:hypothetical protein
MKPEIENTSFGSITINGQRFHKDILLRLDGSIEKRKKKLSKRLYGTSHTISLDEAQFVYEQGAELLVIGTGCYDRVRLSPEAREFLHEHSCRTKLAPTQEAIHLWNEAEGKVIGLFHITC